MHKIAAALILTLGFVLMSCNEQKRPQPTPVIPPQGQSEWQWSFSRGMLPPTKDGDWFVFDWKPNAEGDMLLKKTGPLSGTVRMMWKCGDCQVTPTQGSTATVSLIIVRQGTNWSGDQPSHRFFWQGHPIKNGGGEIEVPLRSENWRNVFGQSDPAGFVATLNAAQQIGLCFGDPGAGATCHGASGTGRFSFTFDVR